VLESYTKDQEVTLVPNPYYWGEKPKADKITFKVITDGQARVLALQSGEVDILGGDLIGKIPMESLLELKNSGKFATNTQGTMCSHFIAFNQKVDAFQDKNVRLAMNYAINKRSIAADQVHSQAFTLRSPPAYAVIKAIKKAGIKMDEPSTARTPQGIAAEINRIKQQTFKIMLTNAMEIGKRLKEAKDLLPHGEWGKWLVESVSYSQRTANRLMQLFEEYGDKLFASGDDGDRSNSSAPTNLTYYQAILLLGIPEIHWE